MLDIDSRWAFIMIKFFVYNILFIFRKVVLLHSLEQRTTLEDAQKNVKLLLKY